MRKTIVSSLVLFILAAAALSSAAFADTLTRSSCWAVTYDNGGVRTMCFLASGRLKMTNVANTTDKNWSKCEFAGKYVRRGDQITIEVPAHSGKCSNGALSPNYNASCHLSDDRLSCDINYTMEGKTRTNSYTLK